MSTPGGRKKGEGGMMPRLKVVLETGPSSRSLALGHAARGTQGRVGGGSVRPLEGCGHRVLV